MKRISTVIALSLLSLACADSRKINGIIYEPVGWAEDKDPCIAYETSTGNIVLSVLFFQTVIVPVILTGWELYEPVGANGKCK